MLKYFVFYLIQIMFKYVKNDCGLPAIPPNAKVIELNSIYIEGTKIEYYCELPELVLLGGRFRECKNNQWIGPIPRCLEEIGFNSINRIEIIDITGKKENHSNPIKSINGRAFSVESSKGECISTRSGSIKPVNYIVYLTRNYRHLSYMEFVLFTGKETNSTTQVLEIVGNKQRTCAPEVAEAAVAPQFLMRIKVDCLMETASDDEAFYSYYQNDITTNISVKLDSTSLTICEIRLFYRKYHRFHACGSVDMPLFSSVDYIRMGSKYGRMPYFRYSCDQNFELIGNSEVRCGLNNYWLDTFPDCVPRVTCPIPPENSIEDMFTTQTNYDKIIVFNGTLVAIPKSSVTYSCATNSSHNIMVGDSVRVCGSNGQWSGVEPYCEDLEQLKVEKYAELIENKIPKEYKMPNYFVNDTTDCGLPGLPVFAKPTPGRLGSAGDFRKSYPNGTRISYRCEPSYHWMYSNFASRICINGKWTGPIDRCELNYAGKVVLVSIEVYDSKSSTLLTEWEVRKPNKTSDNTDIGSTAFNGWSVGVCAPFNVTARQKWVFKLNDTGSISSFSMMFRPGGIYGTVFGRKSTKNITARPLRARLGTNVCSIDFVYDYPKYHTTIKFRCDKDVVVNTPTDTLTNNEITLIADPKQFAKNFSVDNFTLCAITIYYAPINCGIPDRPLHSVIKVESQVVKYSCEDGYKLIGPDTISCLRSGKWSNDSPVCKLKLNLCPKFDKNIFLNSFGIVFKYENTMGNNGTVVFETVVKFYCVNQTSYEGRPLLVGSRTIICQSTGKWSGSQPFCIDSAKYVSRSDNNNSNFSATITALIIVVIIAIISAIVAGIVLLHRRNIINITNLFSFKTRQNLSSSMSSARDVRRPESAVNISDINATLEQLSAFNSRSNNQRK